MSGLDTDYNVVLSGISLPVELIETLKLWLENEAPRTTPPCKDAVKETS